ncbi:DUF975 family protein [Ligilactobacillus sp. WC1T17]|uniref:DUF975 family protein n=1 Tax=Ligilactobacillus sp. WC1T17 TaxID=3158786 RepID=UPI00094BF9C3
MLLIVPGIVKYLAYSQAYFIYKNQPKLTPNQCTEASQELVDGHKRELLLLKLSFLGWFLLSLVTLGLGFIWIILLQWDNG